MKSSHVLDCHMLHGELRLSKQSHRCIQHYCAFQNATYIDVHTIKHVLTTDLFDDFIDSTNRGAIVVYVCDVKSFNWEYIDLVRVHW